jgi:hypothetical protein
MALMVGAAGKAVGVEHVPQLVQTSISNIENDGTVLTPLRASLCGAGTPVDVGTDTNKVRVSSKQGDWCV